MFDLSSNFCFHLRLTCEKERSKELIALFTSKFKPLKFVICHETSESGVAHSHSHIEGDEAFYIYHNSDKGKQARSDFFKKNEMKGLYNFQKLEKTPRQNICYVIKGGEYIAYKGITEAEVEELKQWTAEIEKSKKMEQRDKLLEAFMIYIDSIPRTISTEDTLSGNVSESQNPDFPYQLWQIAQWIHWHYIKEYNKPPPTTHMKEYVLWISSKASIINTQAYYMHLFPM